MAYFGVERRRTPRVEPSGERTLSLGVSLSAEVVDISLTGVQLASKAILAVGDRAELRTTIGARTVSVAIEIRRVAVAESQREVALNTAPAPSSRRSTRNSASCWSSCWERSPCNGWKSVRRKLDEEVRAAAADRDEPPDGGVARRDLARRAVGCQGPRSPGKAASARRWLRSAPRRKPPLGRPFIAVNCAGMPETLLESELFGHVRGSFTGAYRDKPGKLEVADEGTIFLDEIGEMTLRMQGLLLRFLETGEIQKVGADRTGSRVDVRTIAATNRDLREMIAQGLFREDLFYRLNVIHLIVPPLRERKEDIPALVEHSSPGMREPGRPAHGEDHPPRGDGAPRPVPVARQRARAAERHRADGGPLAQ